MYYNPLCNFAASITRDSEKSEDIVQDVFMQFWHNKEVVDVNKNVKSYLFTSVKNKCLEVLRKEKADSKTILGFIAVEANHIHEEEDAAWDEWVKIDQIYSSLRHLPPKCRQVFELAKIKGLTYNQISEMMQISPKTVENHMAKALSVLRTHLLIKK